LSTNISIIVDNANIGAIILIIIGADDGANGNNGNIGVIIGGFYAVIELIIRLIPPKLVLELIEPPTLRKIKA